MDTVFVGNPRPQLYNLDRLAGLDPVSTAGRGRARDTHFYYDLAGCMGVHPHPPPLPSSGAYKSAPTWSQPGWAGEPHTTHDHPLTAPWVPDRSRGRRVGGRRLAEPRPRRAPTGDAPTGGCARGAHPAPRAPSNPTTQSGQADCRPGPIAPLRPSGRDAAPRPSRRSTA